MAVAVVTSPLGLFGFCVFFILAAAIFGKEGDAEGESCNARPSSVNS